MIPDLKLQFPNIADSQGAFAILGQALTIADEMAIFIKRVASLKARMAERSARTDEHTFLDM